MPAAAVLLLRAAQRLGEEGCPRADVEDADALGAVDLVAGERQQIDAEAIDVEVEVAGGLDGVRVDSDARVALLDDADDIGDIVDRADHVVGVDDGDQRRLVVERGGEGLDIDEALAVDREVGDAEALLLQALGGVEDGVVLDLGGDDVVAAAAGAVGDGAQGEVIALGAAGGEEDLLGAGAQQLGDGAAGAVEGLARLTRLEINAGGVAGERGEMR